MIKVKRLKGFVLLGFAVLVLIFTMPLFWSFLSRIDCLYIPTVENPDRYHNLLRNADEVEVKNVFSSGRNEEGWTYVYDYRNKFRVFIWEVMHCNDIEVSNINMETISNAIVKESFAEFEAGTNPTIKVAQDECLLFNNSTRVCLLGEENFIKITKNKDYISYSGAFDRVTLLNHENEVHLNIRSEYNNAPSCFVILKKGGSLFFVYIKNIGKYNNDIKPLEILKIN